MKLDLYTQHKAEYAATRKPALVKVAKASYLAIEGQGAPGTDLLLPGARFQRQFERPGTYDYKCAIHPYMTGRVVVRAP